MSDPLPPPDPVPAPDGGSEAPPEVAEPRRGGRIRSALARLAGSHPDSTRGIALALIATAGTAAVLSIGAVAAVHWSESTEFCTTCHTMAPEQKAAAVGPHKSVACGECHVGPGVTGFVKAKWGGAKELYYLVTDTYERPIHADRDRLPRVEDTCLECHAEERLRTSDGPMQLVLRPTYRSDEANTEATVALALQVNAEKRTTTSESTALGGVHWHLGQDIRYVRTEDPDHAIDLIEYRDPDGTVRQFLGTPELGVASDVSPDLARLTRGATWQTMDCLDCHNRVGHETPTAAGAVDSALAAGQIDASLPYIRKEGVALLAGSYESQEAADDAFRAFATDYGVRHELDADGQAALRRSMGALEVAYALVATPPMEVTATTYANNLGHAATPGCMRCHDGSHFEVVEGRTTDRTISSSCSTCHTFPQTGSNLSELPVGEEPASHGDVLWVFNHRKSVAGTDPGGTDCGSCHTRRYCENCHATGATEVSHDEMMYDHAASIRKAGIQSCATCHQPYMCTTCHRDPVLPDRSGGDLSAQASASRGVDRPEARAAPRYELSRR